MRDRVKEVHSAVDGIDNPLPFAVLIAGESFFAVDRVCRKISEERVGNELLGLDVEIQFDVVGEQLRDVQGASEL